jgi:hypothetical protein
VTIRRGKLILLSRPRRCNTRRTKATIKAIARYVLDRDFRHLQKR